MARAPEGGAGGQHEEAARGSARDVGCGGARGSGGSQRSAAAAAASSWGGAGRTCQSLWK